MKVGGNEMPQTMIYYSIVTYKDRTLFQRGFKEDISEVINPTESVIRYKREWKLSRPKIYNGFLVGKIGYISSGPEKRVDYDEKLMDFVELTVDSRTSTFVFWVIDMSKHMLVFETKTSDIGYQSVRGAFLGFFNKRRDLGLTIEGIPETKKFNEWVDRLDRVIEFNATLRVPNPDYSKYPKIIQDMLEKTRAERASIKLQGRIEKDDAEGGLDTTMIIQDIVQYSESGYASIKARGEEKDKTIIFDSKKMIPSERKDIPKDIDDNSKWALLIEAFRNFIK